MIVIPAVDIRQGNSVRLKQGKIDAQTIHSSDPVFTAKRWQEKGAKRIHVVDLDGAFKGMGQNREIIKAICAEVDVPVEVGGGVRTLDDVKSLFDLGASHIILGTASVQNPDIAAKAAQMFGADKIIVALDAKNGKVAVSGWEKITDIDVLDMAQKLKDGGVEEILYTDISRDGMLTGPDFSGLKKLTKTGMRIIASGGVKTIDDIIELKKLEADGVFAAIVGSALYTENFDLEKAITQAEV